MSIVNNGRVTTNDQNVNKKKYDDGYDTINWGKKDDSKKSSQQSKKQS